VLGLLEDMSGADHKLRHAPTFIIGPPGTATTLLGQIVYHFPGVSYSPDLAIMIYF